MLLNIRAMLIPHPPPILSLPMGYGESAICVYRRFTYQQVLRKLVDKSIKYCRLVQYQLNLDNTTGVVPWRLNAVASLTFKEWRN